MLAWNQRKVRQLTPGEIWLFLVGRTLLALGVGILAARYYPATAGRLGVPSVVVGVIALLVAAKGFARRTPRVDPASRPAV